MYKKMLLTAAITATVGFGGGVVNAATIDFNSYADGTALSSLGDVSFSLAGGPGVIGTPTIGLHSYGEGGLINSTLGAPGFNNGYPTTNILAFSFSGLASGISMKIWEASPVTWTAYDSVNSVVSTGSFVFNGVHAITGSGIKTLALNNNSGNSSWVFSVASMEYTVTAVPEPETYAMMLAGLGVLGAIARRRKAKQIA
jgi:hypothetical protein